eukprot:972165-Rhodomonas_salina.1
MILSSAVSDEKQETGVLLARCAELEGGREEERRKGKENLTELKSWTCESIADLKKRCDEIETLAELCTNGVEEARLSLHTTQYVNEEVDQRAGAAAAKPDVESGKVLHLERELSGLRQLCNTKDADLADAKQAAEEAQRRHSEELEKVQREMLALQEKMVLAYSWHESVVGGVDKR